MKREYQQEISEIHAPADLIARTKAAAKKEEEKLQKVEAGENKKEVTKKRSKIMYFPTTAVAAVALLLIVPAVVNINQPETIKQSEESEWQIAPERVPNRVGEIGFGTKPDVTEVSEKPVEADTAETKEINGVVLFLYQEEATDYWQAYYETDGKKYLVTGEETDKDAFLQDLEDLLNE